MEVKYIKISHGVNQEQDHRSSMRSKGTYGYSFGSHRDLSSTVRRGVTWLIEKYGMREVIGERKMVTECGY